MEHSINPEIELKTRIAYCEKRIRQEQKALKELKPKYTKAYKEVKRIESFVMAHGKTIKAFEIQRDKALGELALLTRNPNIIREQEQGEGKSLGVPIS